MPPWIIGCLIPKSSVIRVLIDVHLSWRPVAGDARNLPAKRIVARRRIANSSSTKLPNWHNTRVDHGALRGVARQAVRVVDAVPDQPLGQLRATVSEHSSLAT